MTLQARLESIAAAAEGRAVHGVYLTNGLRDYMTSGVLPAGPADIGRGSAATAEADQDAVDATREAILDLEEIATLLCGADPDGGFLAALAACRGESFTPAAAEEFRAHTLGLRGRQGALYQIARIGVLGDAITV